MGIELEGLEGLRIERSTTAERVADSLRALIMRGELQPGSPLREATLVAALGVSRNTLREAFRLLSREGLVVHQMHRGVEVKQLTEADVHDIYRTRLPLELTAIERAVKAGPERLKPLREAVDSAAGALAASDFKDVATFDLYFHQRLIELIGSERINTFFEALLAELRLAFAIPADQQAFLEPFLDWNRSICGLLEDGELKRCKAEMRAYLDEAERSICAVLRSVQETQHSPTPLTNAAEPPPAN